MPEFFALLLKINLVLILFAATYYLVLRRLTFYTINRLFLAFGILFSTAYPFIDLTDFFYSQKQIKAAFVPGLNQKVNDLVPSNFIAIHWDFISILFYLGVLFMSIRLILQFVSLYLMHRKSTPGDIHNYPVRILNDAVSPFSFWQTVYLNPDLHEERELKTILAHEQIHVKEWHSLDILLAELSVVFYWFNPGVWLMKKAVKENLEFITDQKILNKGIDRKTYQYSLLDVGNLTPAVEIVNNFNLSDLKKRIKMMNVKRSSRLTLSRYLLVTPILLASTLAFTVSKKDIKKHLMPIRQVLIDHHLISDSTPVESIVLKNKLPKKTTVSTQPLKVDSVKKQTYSFNAIFITTDSLKGGQQELVDQLVEKIAARGIKIGETMKTIHVVRGVKLSDEQRAALTANHPAPSNDLSSGQETIPNVTGRVYNLKVKSSGEPVDGLKARIVFRGASSDTSAINGTSYFIDGKKVNAEELSNLDAKTIKTINVVKRKSEDAVIVVGRKREN